MKEKHFMSNNVIKKSFPNDIGGGWLAKCDNVEIYVKVGIEQ